MHYPDANLARALLEALRKRQVTNGELGNALEDPALIAQVADLIKARHKEHLKLEDTTLDKQYRTPLERVGIRNVRVLECFSQDDLRSHFMPQVGRGAIRAVKAMLREVRAELRDNTQPRHERAASLGVDPHQLPIICLVLDVPGLDTTIHALNDGIKAKTLGELARYSNVDLLARCNAWRSGAGTEANKREVEAIVQALKPYGISLSPSH